MSGGIADTTLSSYRNIGKKETVASLQSFSGVDRGKEAMYSEEQRLPWRIQLCQDLVNTFPT
jgi:hypothetical protein